MLPIGLCTSIAQYLSLVFPTDLDVILSKHKQLLDQVLAKDHVGYMETIIALVPDTINDVLYRSVGANALNCLQYCINNKYPRSRVAFGMALELQYEEAAIMLLDYQVIGNECEWACGMGNSKILKLLIARGFALDSGCVFNAIEYNHPQCLEILLQHNVSIDERHFSEANRLVDKTCVNLIARYTM